MVFHGDKDNTVLIDQSEKINEVYKAANLPIDFHVLKGAGHGGKQFFAPENKKLMIDFLNKHLK